MQSTHDRLIKRFTPVRLALGIALLASGLTRMASAQTGLGGATGTTTTALTAERSPDRRAVDARVSPCPTSTCSGSSTSRTATATAPVYVFFTFTQSGFAKKPTLPEGNIEFWVGLNCNNVTVRNCREAGRYADAVHVRQPGRHRRQTTDAQTLSQNFGQPAVTGTTTVGDGGVVIGDGGATGPSALRQRRRVQPDDLGAGHLHR